MFDQQKAIRKKVKNRMLLRSTLLSCGAKREKDTSKKLDMMIESAEIKAKMPKLKGVKI